MGEVDVRRPVETVETSDFDNEEMKQIQASPDTLPEILPVNEENLPPKGDFFLIEKMKMRENITEIDGRSHNLNGSFSSQELMIRKSDLSVSSHEPVPGCLISSPLSLSAERLPQFHSILESSELEFSYQSRGTEILREIPEFSVREEWEKGPEKEILEEKNVQEAESPVNLLLQVAYFKRKQKKLSDLSIKYEICENWTLDLSNADAVKSPKTAISLNSLAIPGSFQYIISEEPAKDLNFFQNFLQRSVRFGENEAFSSLVPLSRSLVSQQFSADTDFSRPRLLPWSGSALGQYPNTLTFLPALSTLSTKLWAAGWPGLFQRLRSPLGPIARSNRVDACLTLCVLLNTVVLAINRYGIPPEQLTALDTCNLIFTLIFAVEMAVKLLGLGLKAYFRSKMNTFDCVIVTLSVLELTLLSGSGVSGVNAIRAFRTFRVLRVARMFRWMNYTRKIMSKIVDSASKFMYLGLLLLLFMVIFALFGMQLFGGQFSGADYDRSNYDDFNSAFLATFQILTSENWHNVLHNGMRSMGPPSALYFIIWLFLGNFVLLNLFLAILLDAFNKDSTQNSLPAELTCDFPSPSIKLSRKGEMLKKQIEELQQESIESASNSIDTVLSPSRKELYAENHCERSFFVFAKQNCIRLTLTRVITSPRFEQGILAMIALSSVKLIWETYLLNEPDGSTRLQISENLDLAFTVIFSAECMAKTISLGLVLGKGTYLREGWNVLDLVIVGFSLIGLMVSSINMSIIKVFRLLRALRPLRFISHNTSMRIIVSALLESLSALMHVAIVVLLVWLIFAILGVSLFSGQLYQCSLAAESRAECEYYGGEWVNAPFHFDDVVAGMVTLFHLTSPENWNDTMYHCMDTAGKDVTMHKNANPMAAYYIVLIEVVSNFFFLNLSLGVMFDKFEQAKRENTSLSALILLPEQYRWVEMMKLVLHTKQQAENVRIRSASQTFLLKIVGHWAFNAFIMVCIVANVAIMGLIYEEASKDYIKALENLNLAFTAIFTLEATLKIATFRMIYFKDSGNLFDFFVVLMSLLDIVLSNTAFQSGANHMMTIGPQLARTLRLLRVSRMLRLVKQLQIIDDLVGMLRLSLPAILNVLTLVGLVFVIYSVLGVFLFSTVDSGLIVDEFNNFHDFGMALVVLIRASTGEDWNYILTDCKQGANVWLAHLFFFSFVCITTFIMYNMFVMVMLQEYENYQNNPESSFKLFKQHLVVFNAAWNQATSVDRPTRLDSESLYSFAYALDKATFPSHLSRYEVKKKLGRMGIIPDNSGFVYYHEALFRYIRSKHYPLKIAMGVRRKLIEKEEVQYAKQLRKLVKSSKLAEMDGKWDNKSKGIKFFDILFLKSVFGSWQGWAMEWRRAELQRVFGGWKGWARGRRGNSDLSETPPRSEIYPELNSPTFREIDPVAEEPEEAQAREPKISRMSTNLSGQGKAKA